MHYDGNIFSEDWFSILKYIVFEMKNVSKNMIKPKRLKTTGVNGRCYAILQQNPRKHQYMENHIYASELIDRKNVFKRSKWHVAYIK